MNQPTPLAQRWKPLRSGLINLFKYEDQVFQFENGHLLLRGDNGSGKSRVLALQLPFLLDGEISPYRVEPDRDPAKRMEWNLLMDKHERRRGYTWIEFGRVDEASGEEHFLTLGCGLEARKGAGRPDRWFFVSPRRVGYDFQLIQDRRVLSGKELAAMFAEAGAGSIYKKASEYRVAVDEALFKLGARYGPLIDLLIQLRQPQLMRDMKNEELSERLSEALPPVSERLIAEVAESFQGLDSDRQRASDHREMLDSVEGFRDGYRQYLAVAIRRLCEVVRTKHSQFEHATRGLRDIDQNISETAENLGEATARKDAAGAKLTGLEAEIATLRDSPEMRSKRDLEQKVNGAEMAEKEVTMLRADFEKAGEDVRRAATEQKERATECGRLGEDFVQARQVFALGSAVISPTGAGAELFVRKALGTDRLEGMPELSAARVSIEKSIAERERSIGHLRGRNGEVAGASGRLVEEKAAAERSRSARDAAAEKAGATEAQMGKQVEAFADAAARWERSLEVLSATAFPRGEDWAELLAEWLDGRATEFVFKTTLEAARVQIGGEIADSMAVVKSQLGEWEKQRAEIELQLDELRAGHQPLPPMPHSRAPRTDDRAGAPFWKCCEFHQNIPDDERAGWEAALESSGLLDAWVSADGEVFENDDFLGVGSDAELETSSSLAAILRPAAAADGGRMADILMRIGNHRGAARCWIDKSGHWANGPRLGHWRKPAAEFLGHRAREEARQRRIGEIEQELDKADSEIARCEEIRTSCDQRSTALKREVDAAPSIRAAEQSAIVLERDREALQAVRTELVEAEERVLKAQQGFADTVARRDTDAADMGLAEWAEPSMLEKFSCQLADFEKLAIRFWPRWEQFSEKEKELHLACGRESTALQNEAEKRQRHDEKDTRARRARAEADTLLASVGATVEELIARLVGAEDGARTVRGERDTAAETIRKAEIENARLEAEQRAAREKREASEADRNTAVGRMEVFVAERLFEEVDPEFQPLRAEFSATAAVELARRMEQELKDHLGGDEQWGRMQSEITQRFSEFSDQLVRHGHLPRQRVIDESSVSVIDCEFQGQRRTMLELRDLIAGELANREKFFEEREREIIENHLIGEAASELQKRIRSGEDWVTKVNTELAQVTTSSGIHLKFGWGVADTDADDAQVRGVRALFLKTSATWNGAERDQIGRFLQARIQAERDADDSVSWRDHLTRALDYRSWHQFDVLRKTAGDTAWKKLTKRTFGTGSGGEKAMTLTVPQFAAAAAHYQSADRYAPRLILLDEVFVGIDAPTRGRLMGLMETFDLDYMMTSEREWGAFPSVSALAIYQLASRPNFNAVAVTRWVWNGREKRRAEPGDGDSSRSLPTRAETPQADE